MISYQQVLIVSFFAVKDWEITSILYEIRKKLINDRPMFWLNLEGAMEDSQETPITEIDSFYISQAVDLKAIVKYFSAWVLTSRGYFPFVTVDQYLHLTCNCHGTV